MFEGLTEELECLRVLDPGYWVFGSTTHRHRLAPPASPGAIAELEKRLGIQIPYEYRTFITKVGNGGMGPGYGLDRLVLIEEPLDPCQFRTEGVSLVVKQGNMTFMAPRYADSDGVEIDPFELSLFGLANRLLDDQFIEQLRRPFPLDDAYEAPQDQEWEQVHGLLPINDYGCAMSAGIVLNGPRVGEIWVSDPNAGITTPFAAYAGLHDETLVSEDSRTPTSERPTGFKAWYRDWLDRAIASPELPSTPTSA